MKITDEMVLFYGGPFSQWFPSDIEIDGINYCTAEQFMMAMKADYFGDDETKRKIMATQNPSEQKALGRQVANFDKEAWDAVSRGYVYQANMVKFSSPSLNRFLKDTKDKIIVEASPYDRIWGIGRAVDDPRSLDKSQWRGTNWLGEVLMKVRNDLKETK